MPSCALLCPPAEEILPRVRFASNRLESAQETRWHHWCLPLHITAFSLRYNIPLGAEAGHRLGIWELRVEWGRIFRGIQSLSRYSGPQKHHETAAPPENERNRIWENFLGTVERQSKMRFEPDSSPETLKPHYAELLASSSYQSRGDMKTKMTYRGFKRLWCDICLIEKAAVVSKFCMLPLLHSRMEIALNFNL